VVNTRPDVKCLEAIAGFKRGVYAGLVAGPKGGVTTTVMAGLVPAIHAFVATERKQDLDARVI